MGKDNSIEKEFNNKINLYLNQILKIDSDTYGDLIIPTIQSNPLIANQSYKF
jgi:hypothetical protein